MYRSRSVLTVIELFLFTKLLCEINLGVDIVWIHEDKSICFIMLCISEIKVVVSSINSCRFFQVPNKVVGEARLTSN